MSIFQSRKSHKMFGIFIHISRLCYRWLSKCELKRLNNVSILYLFYGYIFLWFFTNCQPGLFQVLLRVSIYCSLRSFYQGSSLNRNILSFLFYVHFICLLIKVYIWQILTYHETSCTLVRMETYQEWKPSYRNTTFKIGLTSDIWLPVTPHCMLLPARVIWILFDTCARIFRSQILEWMWPIKIWKDRCTRQRSLLIEI